MSCEYRNNISQMSLVESPNKAYFGPKQVQNKTNLKVGNNYMLYSAGENLEGQMQIDQREVKVKGFTKCHNLDVVILEVQTMDREALVIWKTSQQLGLAPDKGMWQAREWLSYCKK